MRTWLVLAAVLAVAAAAAADALRGGLRDHGAEQTRPAAERRIVPPGVPAGFMGTVFYSDPGRRLPPPFPPARRLHRSKPAEFRRLPVLPVTGRGQSRPEGSAWSPLGGLVAVPRDDGLALEAGPGQVIVVRGRAPAFKPDGTLTQVRGGRIVEWTNDCRPGERHFTLPGRQRDGALRPHLLIRTRSRALPGSRTPASSPCSHATSS